MPLRRASALPCDLPPLPAAPTVSWLLLHSPPATGVENMALDHALMVRAQTHSEWVLRVYTWSEPTISLGRNQLARERYDLAAIGERGIHIVRRPTGGRAILHDREITYSVTAPVAGAGDLRESYERINRILLSALHALGAPAQVASPAERAAAPGMAPCFDTPAAGELIVGGRKLAGSAQWRADGALLQHGSILVADDQSLLASLAREPGRSIPPPATLGEALGRAPTAVEVTNALFAAVHRQEDSRAPTLTIDDELRLNVSAFVDYYSDQAWTWRR
jgi:lipoyl(octanoyl) transferase